MDIKKIAGQNKGDIMIYALSTCGWCKRTKQFFNDLGIAYQFTDVDLLNPKDQEIAVQEIKKWNPACSFPTTVINNKACIVGYNVDKIKEALRL